MASADAPLFDPPSDDISSLTSSSDEANSQDEWSVRGILAEAKVQGETKYLIDWDGFELCDATWEPACHLGEGLLADWLAAKEQTGRKTVSGFTIEAWRRAVRDHLGAKYAKSLEKLQKRVRLGLKHRELQYSLEELLKSVPGLSEGEIIEAEAEVASAQEARHITDSASDDDIPLIAKFRTSGQRRRSTKELENVSLSQETTSASERPRIDQEDPTRPTNSETALHSDFESLTVSPERPRGTDASKIPLKTKSHPSDSPRDTIHVVPRRKGVPDYTKSRASAVDPAARKKGSYVPALTTNIFIGGNKRKARRNLEDAASDPTQPPKLLNHHKRRIIEKRSRDKEGVIAPGQLGQLLPVVSISQTKTNPAQTAPSNGKEGEVPSSRNSIAQQSLEASNNDVRKRVHWDDEPSCTKRQARAESESLFVEDDASFIAPEIDSPSEKIKAESPSTKQLDLTESESLFVEAGASFTSLQINSLSKNLTGDPPCTNLQSRAQSESLFVENEAYVAAPEIDPRSGKITDEPDCLGTDLTSSVLPEPSPLGTLKACQFGDHAGSPPVLLRFEGVDLMNKAGWSKCFAGQDALPFSYVCTIQDLISQTGCQTVEELSLLQGTISSSDTEKGVVKTVANRLQAGCFVAACHQNDYCILIFCPSSFNGPESFWDTSNSLPVAPCLGFLILKPGTVFPPSMLAPAPRLLATRSALSLDCLTTLTFFSGGTKDDLTVGRKVDEIANYFLLFPPAAHQDVVLFSQWLRELTTHCTIKTTLQPGQWFSFLALERGTVIIHEDVVWTIMWLPNLSNVLHGQYGKVEFLVFSPSGTFGRPVSQLKKSSPLEDSYHLTKVFSQGIVILLTPSFVVSQPEQAYRFLKWFWMQYIEHGSSELGKLAVCSDMGDWMLDLALYKGTNRANSTKHPSNAKASESATQAWLKCCNLLQHILGETEEHEDGPLVYAPDVLDGNDEQSLVNWFGSWAILHIQEFRKFLVLGSSSHTEGKLSRLLQPVQLVTSCSEYLHYQNHFAIGRQSSERSQESAMIPEAVLAEEAQSFLTDIDRSFQDLNFSPLVLYKSLVTYSETSSPLQLGDYGSYFKNYHVWFDYFRKPFFLRVMQPNSVSELPKYKNTYLGLFYTTNKKRRDPFSPMKQVQSLRPWIAIYRPVEIHNKPWTKMELLLWDPLARHADFRSNDFCGAELLVAQEALISHVQEKSKDSSTALPLERVWLGPFDDHQDEGVVDPLDYTLRWLKHISTLVKERLPLSGKQLLSRGWHMVNMNALSTSQARDASRTAPETPSSGQQCLPLRTTYPAPRPYAAGDTLAICNNRFQEALLKYEGRDEIPFTFRPTLEWYEEQVKAGRGLEHIQVSSWQSIFAGYKISTT